LRVAGAGLLAATAAIHLDLYLTGYRTIPTIGWLFLAQVITAFLLAAAVLASGSRIVAAAGAGFAVATLGGHLLSVWAGLFGFTEVRTTAGITAGIIEVAAFAALAVLALASAAQSQRSGPAAAGSALLAWVRAGVCGAGWAVAVASVAALVVLGVSVSRAGGPAPAAAGSLRTAEIGGATVLTNAGGFTVYWFALDTATTSYCSGSCAAHWPPVTGIPESYGGSNWSANEDGAQVPGGRRHVLAGNAELGTFLPVSQTSRAPAAGAGVFAVRTADPAGDRGNRSDHRTGTGLWHGHGGFPHPGWEVGCPCPARPDVRRR
jgi:predicted lipoprotein with Yx(FWY)xxD motif